MDELKLGYAREDFSPDKPVHMNSQWVGETVLEPIYATAMSFSQGDSRLLVFSLDLRNVYKYFLDIVKPLVSEATGVPEEAIYFHNPHNHSSPDISNPNWEDVADWRERIGIPGIIRAAKAAIADEKPVTGLVGGETMTQYINYVRRYRREDGTWYGIATTNTSKAPIVAHESEADPSLRAARISREGGKDVVMVHYQTHAAGALGQQKGFVNADFVGPLRDKLETQLDCKMIYLQGACGNCNYATRIQEEKETYLREYHKVGEAIADYAIKALENGKPMQLGKLQYRTGITECYVNHTKDHLAPRIEELRQMKDQPEAQEEGFRQIGVSPRYESTAIIRRLQMGQTEPVEVAAFAIGDLAFTFAPFEMFHQNGEQLRAASPYEMTFNCGYALNYRGYMPAQECWPHGEYEVYMCHFLPGTGEAVVLAHLAQLRDMKKSE